MTKTVAVSLADVNVDVQIEPQGSDVPTSGPDFAELLKHRGLSLKRSQATELQLNLGKLCNLACHHCHVDAGPKRTEIMTQQTMLRILDWIETSDIRSVDLTGGAPELNPHFRWLCEALIAKGISLISRCNLTVLYEPGQEDLAQWYAQHKVRLVCSLPCYTEDNVDAQRGKGTFDKSISALQELNALGYGTDPELQLDLVYNPNGAFLPPAQDSLENDYRTMLQDEFSIVFSSLLTITNIPINRFAHSLRRDGKLDDYQQLLVDNFNPATLDGLMCRNTINVGWQGEVYDCDFNQMLELPMAGTSSQTYLWQLDSQGLKGQDIAIDRHCFGCTAGAGSSCGGSLVE